MRFVRLFALVLMGLAPACAAAGESFYVAVGSGGHRMFSRDGITWENHSELGPAGHDQNDLNVVTSFKGTIVIGGGYSTGRLLATRDGKNWSDGELPDGKLSMRKSEPIFGAEVFGDTLYFMTLHGQVYATKDMENYDEIARVQMPRARWVRHAVQGNGLMLGSGDYGPVLLFDPAHPEQAMFTQMDSQEDRKVPPLRRVAFGNGMFVVGGQNGLIARTRDGKNWENNVAVAERGDVSSVVWAGDHFLAHTKNMGALVSPDGVTWTKQEQAPLPLYIIRANEYLFGWGQMFGKQAAVLSRSKDGITWEPAKNTKGHTVLSIGYVELAGSGDPPKLPPAKPRPPRGNNQQQQQQ